MPPPWFFGQAFLLAGRWSCLCEYPATAEAAFKVSEQAKWPYFFNAAKSLVRDLLQDIYRDKGKWQTQNLLVS